MLVRPGEVSASSESSSTKSTESLPASPAESLPTSPSGASSFDDSSDEVPGENLDKEARDPLNVIVESLELLLNRYKPNKVSIFKFGASTSLTMGFIKNFSIKKRLDETHYSNLIEVEWINGTEFASGGDCGSWYFVYDLTTNAFVPIAMHVASKEKQSYGILVSYIFEQLSKKRYKFLICNKTVCHEK